MASTQAGMGARFFGAGTGFRVWAPFAQSISVAGEFNSWSKVNDPLSSEGNGYWSTDVAGATVGQAYKYVLVDAYGNERWRNDPYARELTPFLENTLIHDSEIGGPNFNWSGDNFQMPSWNELIIYEMHIGTFHPSSITSTSKFAEAAAQLPYLRDLGINCVQIMAASEFPTQFSWGYNPTYLFAIESSYGGINGFKDFVKAAHLHGIAVIFDVVYNHIGADAHDMWQFDGWNENGHGGIYFYNDWRRTTPWGDRPDYGRGEVRQYLRDNALTWLEKRHIDGLRWDASAFIRNVHGRNNDAGSDLGEGWGLMQWINNEINASQPWKIIIAEDLQNNEWVTKDTGAGGAGCDSQWDASFVHPIRRAIIPAADENRDMNAVRDAILHRYGTDASKRVIYTESHDEVANGHSRVPEEIWPGKADSWASKKRSTLGAGLVFTSPGIPMMFQGQEFLEWGYFNDQVPLDWSKASSNSGILNLYRDLIRLRRNWFDTTRGLRGQHVNVHHLNNSDKLVAYHRWAEGGPRDDVVVVANFANRRYDNYTIGFPRPGLWKVRFNSDSASYSPDFNNHFCYDTQAGSTGQDGMPYSASVGVGQYSVVIFSQD